MTRPSHDSMGLTARCPGVMQRWASRGLLAAWLLYSAGALGWFLAQDPLLSLYVCGAR
ncbi:MAG: hypothetical protein AB1697_05535 [Pseudomonadota bacterium]